MNTYLETYQERHLEMAKSEKVGNARRMLKIAQRVAPRWAQATENIYRYVRVLDDAVDESPYIKPIKRQLEEEKSALQDPTSLTHLQQEYLQSTLEDYFKNDQEILRQNLHRILQGLSYDLQIRDTQQPYTSRQLLTRNCLDIWPCFAIFSLGTTGVLPKPTANTIKLIDTFATYDNISDTPEDLSHGLNLIPKEDLEKYHLKFTNGQPLPIDRLVEYHHQKGKLIAPLLRRYAGAFFQTGMPIWLAALSYCYFYSRSFKLLKPLPIQKGLTYQIPKDSQVVCTP